VAGDLHALGGVGGDKAILPGRGENLAHGDEHLVLQALGIVCDAGHHAADVYRAHGAQLHRADNGHYVIVVGVAVHSNGGGAQIGLIGGEPDFGPFANGCSIADL
jgi:hypothetical protein